MKIVILPPCLIDASDAFCDSSLEAYRPSQDDIVRMTTATIVPFVMTMFRIFLQALMLVDC